MKPFKNKFTFSIFFITTSPSVFTPFHFQPNIFCQLILPISESCTYHSLNKFCQTFAVLENTLHNFKLAFKLFIRTLRSMLQNLSFLAKRNIVFFSLLGKTVFSYGITEYITQAINHWLIRTGTGTKK